MFPTSMQHNRARIGLCSQKWDCFKLFCYDRKQWFPPLSQRSRILIGIQCQTSAWTHTELKVVVLFRGSPISGNLHISMRSSLILVVVIIAQPPTTWIATNSHKIITGESECILVPLALTYTFGIDILMQCDSFALMIINASLDMEVSWNRGTPSHHPFLDGIFP